MGNNDKPGEVIRMAEIKLCDVTAEIEAGNAQGESRGIPRTLDPIVGSSSEGTE